MQRGFSKNRRGKEGNRVWESERRDREIAEKRKIEETNTEKWERGRWELEEKIKAQRKFVEGQNQLQKAALYEIC